MKRTFANVVVPRPTKSPLTALYKSPEFVREWRLQTAAMNIVNQLFDLAKVPVKKRQAINDRSTEFVVERLKAWARGR